MSTRRDWRSARLADALWGGTAIFVIIALAARVWPTRAKPRELPPFVATPVSSPAAFVRNDGALETFLATDIFSARRSAPLPRWTPPVGDTLPPGFAPDPTAAAVVDVPNASADGPPRLYGFVTDASGAAALLWLDANVPGAQLYREGSQAGGWRVVHIDADRVTLDAPGGGRRTLRLMRAPAPAPARSPTDSSRS